MIYDQLVTLDAMLRDPATGLAARVAEIAARKGVATPAPADISTWAIKHGTEFDGFPAVQQLWVAMPRADLESQGSWEGDFGFIWQFWFKVHDPNVQQHLAIYMHAARALIDSIPGNGTIANVGDVQAEQTGNRELGSQYAVVMLAFVTTEMDNDP